MRSARILGALLFPILAGCGPASWTLEGFKNPNRGGLKRAAFELQCSEAELQLTELGGNAIGVTGCGKRAVYKWAYGAGWVNNTGGEDAPKK